jgi:DNA-binding transcriptional MerR regulator
MTNTKPTDTAEARQRDRCEITGCESPAIYRGTCSPDHHREMQLRRRAKLLGITIDEVRESIDRPVIEDGRVNLKVARSGRYDVAQRDAVMAALLDEVEHLRSALAQIADDRDAEREVTGRQARAMRTALANAEAAGFVDAFGEVEGGVL